MTKPQESNVDERLQMLQKQLVAAKSKLEAKKKFKVREYHDSKRPHLKFVINGRENGKRTRWFFATKAEAEADAQLKRIELENKGREGAEFPSWLRVMSEECNKRLAEHKCTIKDATEHLLAHIAATKKSCTASELVEKLRAAKKTDGASVRYLQDLRSRLNRFADAFDGQLVATITTARLDEWLRGLNVSPVTRNNFRRLLIVAFNYAVQQGYATHNPAENTSKAKEKTGAPGILTVNETARLLEAASPGVLPYVAVGAFAGLRRAELERLDWSEIDFDSDLIEVTAEKAKTARRRFVRMQPNLREWLLPVRKRKGAVVCDDFRNEFDAARGAAKIADWPDNALRHSFASYHLAHFKDAAALALEMGHTNSGMIFDHYRELVKPKEAERFWNVRPAATEKGKIVSIEAARAVLRGPIKKIEKMGEEKVRTPQPDLGYIDAASQKAAVEAAIKRGLSKAEAERFYGRLRAQKGAHEKNAQKARSRFGRARRSG